jgi:AraC family transcriptional regulator
MAERRARALFESPLMAVFDVCCRAGRSGCGPAEWSSVAHIVLPRRGVFVVHRGGEDAVADVNTALILGAGDEYRVSHPCDGGDDCTVLLVEPGQLEEAVGGVGGRHAQVRPRDRFALCLGTRALGDGGSADPLEGEEAALVLLAAVGSAFAEDTANSVHVGHAQRVRVEEVRALLATAPTRRWDLQEVASVVHCSPFHLARQFRALTGETISRYLLRLRLGMALERLAEGEDQLASLAHELGFAHHSHFSARFRAVFGLTPTLARESLTRRRLPQVRTIVTAART